MPNGHDYTREYGGHKYPSLHSTNDCEHGCGCSAGPSTSGGPLGLNPIGGECPNNPECGKRLPGNADYEIVVVRRIRAAEKRASDAEAELERVAPGARELAEELRVTNEKLGNVKQLLREIAKLADKIPDE